MAMPKKYCWYFRTPGRKNNTCCKPRRERWLEKMILKKTHIPRKWYPWKMVIYHGIKRRITLNDIFPLHARWVKPWPLHLLVGSHLTSKRVTFSPSQKGHKELPGDGFFHADDKSHESLESAKKSPSEQTKLVRWISEATTNNWAHSSRKYSPENSGVIAKMCWFLKRQHY